MKDFKNRTKVVHSKSKYAWNVVSTVLGKKYKVAQIPYLESRTKPNETLVLKQEALEYATYISECINNSEKIIPLISNG